MCDQSAVFVGLNKTHREGGAGSKLQMQLVVVLWHLVCVQKRYWVIVSFLRPYHIEYTGSRLITEVK